MRALARQVPLLFSKISAGVEGGIAGRPFVVTSVGSSGFRNFEVPRRNVQTWKKGLSTEAAAKVAPQDNLVEPEAQVVNLETLGNSREKIEVDGMLINWDKVGSGDHVVLMLPGIIGK